MPKMLEVVSTTDYLTEQKIKEVVEGHTCITHYIYVLHDKDFLEDGSPKKPHWHVYLKFTDNRQFEDVAKWFGISSNFLGYIKGRWVDALSCGIVSLINIFQPELFVIGGGVSGQKQFLLDLLVPNVAQEQYSRNIERKTKLLTALCGNDAGIIGAAFA